MALVPAKCTMCGANLDIDDTQERFECAHCGTEFITEKIMNNNIINNFYVGIDNASALTKNDIITAFKYLEMSGYAEKGEDEHEDMYNQAIASAQRAIRKDPTSYEAWKCLVCIQAYGWEYSTPELKGREFDANILKLKKLAKTKEEKAELEKMRMELRKNYYFEKLDYQRKFAQPPMPLKPRLGAFGKFCIFFGVIFLIGIFSPFFAENMFWYHSVVSAGMALLCFMPLIVLPLRKKKAQKTYERNRNIALSEYDNKVAPLINAESCAKMDIEAYKLGLHTFTPLKI